MFLSRFNALGKWLFVIGFLIFFAGLFFIVEGQSSYAMITILIITGGAIIVLSNWFKQEKDE